MRYGSAMSAVAGRAQVLRVLHDHRGELRRLGVRKLGLFGSHLHDTARADSDIDLLVSFERPSFDDYMDTKFLLEDLFGRKVDLVTDGALKRALSHVRQEAAYVEGL